MNEHLIKEDFDKDVKIEIFLLIQSINTIKRKSQTTN